MINVEWKKKRSQEEVALDASLYDDVKGSGDLRLYHTFLFFKQLCTPISANPLAYRDNPWEERYLARIRCRCLPTQLNAFIKNLRSCRCCRLCHSAIESHDHILSAPCDQLNTIPLEQLYRSLDLDPDQDSSQTLLREFRNALGSTADPNCWETAAAFVISYARINKLFRKVAACERCELD